jgi:hypothetical protein
MQQEFWTDTKVRAVVVTIYAWLLWVDYRLARVIFGAVKSLFE